MSKLDFIPDVVVVGAGTVGAAIGYGLSMRGQRVLVLDGGDTDFRAANANFGLIYVQGKGLDMPAYQRLSRQSADLWKGFGPRLAEDAGMDLQYERRGGLTLCLGEEEFEDRRLFVHRLHNQLGGNDPGGEMIDRSMVERLLPKARLGVDVVGAEFRPGDGHVNPLRLLAALKIAIERNRGVLLGNAPVMRICPQTGQGFSIETAGMTVSTERVVIAAGLGSAQLAAQVGMPITLRPLRGQILVTERLTHFLSLPTLNLRQTREGTVMIGATHDDVGYDNGVSAESAATLAARAVRSFPDLAAAQMIRTWSGLRIMTPDGHPIYAESKTCPGAFVAMCHSGVTLAAAHATILAEAITNGTLGQELGVYHHERFDVQKAA